MSSPKPGTTELLLQWLQNPKIWVPGFLTIVALVFITDWVIYPDAQENTENEAIVNETARQQLTPEQSALASEIDDLDVLLQQLDNQAPQDPLPPSPVEDPSVQDSLILNTTPLASASQSSEFIAAPSQNPIDRSPVLRNFFTNRSTLETEAHSSTASAFVVVSPSGEGSLSLSLQQPALLPPGVQSSSPAVFGAPQAIGLPRSLSSAGSPTVLTHPAIPSTSAVNVSAPPYGTAWDDSSLGRSPNPSTIVPIGYPYHSSVSIPGTIANPGIKSPYTSYSGTGLPNSTGANIPPEPIVPVSPYTLDPSFNNPLAPVETPGSEYRFAPGQYVGNGEVNTFANP